MNSYECVSSCAMRRMTIKINDTIILHTKRGKSGFSLKQLGTNVFSRTKDKLHKPTLKFKARNFSGLFMHNNMHKITTLCQAL